MENPENLQNEIADLEARLALKKEEMLDAGSERPEKQIFKEVIKERAQGGAETAQAPMSSPASASAATDASDADKQKVADLVQFAFTHGIAGAVQKALASGDALLIDLLHDQLADQYYEKLLQARKIK